MIETVYILGAIVAFCAATGAYVLVKGAIQLYVHVVSWFRLKMKIGGMNPHAVALTIRERLHNGDYGISQALYDEGAGRILDAQSLRGQDLDPELAHLHRRQDMVIYPTRH